MSKEFYPGWQMTKNQRDLLLRLWSQACRYQGWTSANGLNSKMVDALRRRETEKVFGEPKSWKEISWRGEFDKIKNHFLFLAGNVKGTIRTDRPDLDEKQRLLKFIQEDLLRCLALYRPPERYLQDILRDGHRIYSGLKTIEDLSAAPRPPRDGEDQPRPSQLQCLIYTLSARINTLRNEAGDTIHDMRMRAGLECTCAACCPKGANVAAVAATITSDLAGEERVEVAEPVVEGDPF